MFLINQAFAKVNSMDEQKNNQRVFQKKISKVSHVWSQLWLALGQLSFRLVKQPPIHQCLALARDATKRLDFKKASSFPVFCAFLNHVHFINIFSLKVLNNFDQLLQSACTSEKSIVSQIAPLLTSMHMGKWVCIVLRVNYGIANSYGVMWGD